MDRGRRNYQAPGPGDGVDVAGGRVRLKGDGTTGVGGTVLTAAALSGATLLWGVSFVATKIALQGLPPSTLIFARFVCAALVFGAALAVRGFPRLAGPAHLRLITLAVFQPVLYFVFETAGLDRITAAEVSLVIGTIPVGVMLLSRLFLAEGLRPRKVAGAALTVIGVITLVVGDLDLWADGVGGAVGYLYAFGAVVAAALYMVLARSLSKSIDPFSITAFQFIYGSALFLPVFAVSSIRRGSVLSATPVALPSMLAVGYLIVFATIGGFLCYNYGLSRTEASRASVYINGVPVVAAVTSWLVLGEQLSPVQFVGAAVVLIGIYVATVRSRRTPSG